MALVYSCCFWFSLRLGGILIAVFSMTQALAVLIGCCVAWSRPQSIKDSTTTIIDSLNLIYVKSYLENFQQDPEKYLSFGVTFSSIYILICLLYAYGAYAFKNIIMLVYILVELLRLIFLGFVIITCLLVIRENTMDIGVLIGSCVAGSFFLLGMSYLWICAANLPILINELERDQQAATIYKLQQMLKMNTSTSAPDREKPLATINFQRNNISNQQQPTFQNTALDSNQFHYSHFYH